MNDYHVLISCSYLMLSSGYMQLAISIVACLSQFSSCLFSYHYVVAFLPMMHLDIHHSQQHGNVKMNQNPNEHVTSSLVPPKSFPFF